MLPSQLPVRSPVVRTDLAVPAIPFRSLLSTGRSNQFHTAMTRRTSLTPLFLFCFIVFAHLTNAQSGMALSLDGVDDRMEVADHAALDIDPGESFTVTLWVKTSQSTDAYRMVSKRVTAGGAGYELTTQAGAGALGMNLRSTSNSNANPPYGTTSITDGGWHHVAMVVDAINGTASILVDGTQENTITSAAIGTEDFSNSVPLILGTSIAQTVFMNAQLDDVRIWQNPLSEAEIMADMTAVVTGTEPGLIAAWDFENVAGTTVNEITGVHPGTLYGGATTVPIAATMIYTGSTLLSTSTPVGRGEPGERVIGVRIITSGSDAPLSLSEIAFNLNGTTDLADLQDLKIYATGANPRLDTTTAVFATATVQAGTIVATGAHTLIEGNNHFWIACDVSGTALEGHVIKGELVSITVSGQNHTPDVVSSTDERLILLEYKTLFSGGDYGSANYRIPAVVRAADGSLVVAADARINGPGDLPGDIDVVVRRSTDNGETWSPALTIADFGTSGASDPALVLDRNSGDLLCMFASHTGLFASTHAVPIRFQVCRSQDNGVTWSAPVEHTSEIYAPTWYAAWLASGNAHQLRSGRIVGAIGVRQTSGSAISNFMIYSDDGGTTWNYKPTMASSVGDEAKLVELDNGDLMMNIRNQTPNLRRIVRSSDGGDSWGSPSFQAELIDPFVNGEILRYTSTLDGYDTSRLLFSIPAHPTTRQNLTIFLSYDEGDTWPVSKTLHPGLSAYSSLAILDDGTIGCFYENGEYEAYQLSFARFSLDWLTNGADTWTPANAIGEHADASFSAQLLQDPGADQATLIVRTTEAGRLSGVLYDALGHQLDTLFSGRYAPGTHQLPIDLRGKAAGNYLVKVTQGERKVTVKMVVGR